MIFPNFCETLEFAKFANFWIFLKLDKFTEIMRKGWITCGIMNAFWSQISAQVKYYKGIFDWNSKPFIPFKSVQNGERNWTDEEAESKSHSDNCCDDDDKSPKEIGAICLEEQNPLGLSEFELAIESIHWWGKK